MSVLLQDEQDTKMHIEIEEVVVKGGAFFDFVKRAFDIVLSLLGLVCMVLPMIVIAVVIRLDTPGPAIYKQERLGLNRKPFTIYKFRSMYTNAEDDCPKWAEKEDTRVTPVGRILRNTRLDELPQLWNILCGEMSFVGPRPERDCFYVIFEEYIPHFGQRMLVKPGLTGWAQVHGGYDLEPEEKIVFDLEYINKRSFMMELDCILRTVKLVFTHDGAR